MLKLEQLYTLKSKVEWQDLKKSFFIKQLNTLSTADSIGILNY
jgi:hypothetical protein